MTVQIHEAHHGRFIQVNSLLRSNLLERAVDVRKMIRGNVAHEGTGDFVIAHAAMQPAQEQEKLQASGKDGGQNAVPVDAHGFPFGLGPASTWGYLIRAKRGN
jgi:hypothetical protein